MEHIFGGCKILFVKGLLRLGQLVHNKFIACAFLWLTRIASLSSASVSVAFRPRVFSMHLFPGMQCMPGKSRCTAAMQTIALVEAGH